VAAKIRYRLRERRKVHCLILRLAASELGARAPREHATTLAALLRRREAP
jgi:hypothetical protein